MMTVNFIKEKKVYFIILFIISFVLIIPQLGVGSHKVDIGRFVLYENYFMNYVDVAALALYSYKKLVSDEFLVSRLMGDFNWSDEHEYLAKDAYYKNQKLVYRFSVVLICSIISVLMFILQPLFFIFIFVALTFYSMEVFGVDTGIKNRQEEREKELQQMKNLKPIPINNV